MFCCFCVGVLVFGVLHLWCLVLGARRSLCVFVVCCWLLCRGWCLLCVVLFVIVSCVLFVVCGLMVVGALVLSVVWCSWCVGFVCVLFVVMFFFCAGVNSLVVGCWFVLVGG